MGLDNFIFLIRQLGRLVDYPVRNGDFPHIMQQRNTVDFLLLGLGLAHTSGNLPGIPGNPAGMTVGIGVFGIYCPCKSENCLIRQ